MRRLKLAALLVFLFPAFLSAQTVDEIVAKNTAAKGGLARLKAIQSMRITGGFDVGGLPADFTQVFKRPLRVRFDVSVQGMTMTQAYDGKIGWQIVPFTGKKDPEAMAADDIKRLQEDADFDGPLVDYKQKGHLVELVGREKVDGADAYHLRITLKSGGVRNLYLDANTWLAIKSDITTRMQGAEVQIETRLGDYKEVEGMMFPFSIEQHAVGTPNPSQKIALQKVEINVPVDDAIFKMPAAAKPPAASDKTGAVPK